MTLFTEQGDVNCPPLRRMVMYSEREQKDLGIKCYQTWRLKAQDQAPSPLLELVASYLHAFCPIPLTLSSEKHSALFHPVHFDKLTPLWMIHIESNAL